MLKRFEVTNFKNFNEKFVFDLSETRSYTFNENCVENGIVKTGMVYGPNGCGKTNLGYAIFDIKNHLTDDKISDIYKKDYLNAENGVDIAEFKYLFQFGESSVEYSYGKYSVEKFAYEKVLINDELMVSFERGKSESPVILLEGTEHLNKSLDDDSISIVKYIGANSVLDKDVNNIIFENFLNFVGYMTLIQPVGRGNYIGIFPEHNWLKLIVNEQTGDTLERFEEFINDAGIKCRLNIAKNIDEERLVFDFGDKKIDFMSNSSSGTQVLTGLYIDLRILRLSIVNNENKEVIDKEKIERVSEKSIKIISMPFIFVDEFDAYYNHSLSEMVVKELRDLNCQAVLTTHNTSIMTNDLLRPDCYFTMQNESIKPIYQNTDKELRKAHSLEKMYRAGSFNE